MKKWIVKHPVISISPIVLFFIIMNISTGKKHITKSKFGNIPKVCSFLENQGIYTQKSKNPKVTGSICLSGYLELDGADNNKIPNNIAYYVEGIDANIQRLKVISNFNQPSKYATDKTISAFNVLLKKSYNIDKLISLDNAIKNKTSKTWNITANKEKIGSIKLIYDKWPNTGYEFKLIVE